MLYHYYNHKQVIYQYYNLTAITTNRDLSLIQSQTRIYRCYNHKQKYILSRWLIIWISMIFSKKSRHLNSYTTFTAGLP